MSQVEWTEGHFPDGRIGRNATRCKVQGPRYLEISKIQKVPGWRREGVERLDLRDGEIKYT